jgi:hypothetical protein
MDTVTTRRGFLRTAATGGTLLGLGELSLLSGLPPVSAADAKLSSEVVPLPPDIEPLVCLLEAAPRERLLEEVAARVRRGLSYGEILTALLLAGVRNVQPRPSVGFKFHAVLVVNSVHLATLAAADADRWLPLFWALDYFKDSQARNQQEGGWRMKPVAEQAVPPAHKARQAFLEAMDAWDEAAADAAVAGLARSAGADEVFELLYRYGARDFRSIGHKAIFVANSQRVLGQIGWRYAEPVLRSLAYGLLMHEDGNPAQRDDAADRPWRHNQKLAAQIPADWQAGKPSREATVELLAVLRQGSNEAVPEKVVELLRRGTAPQSIWDAVFLGAGELLLRQPGIVALHAATTTNALHYAYQTSADDSTRRLLLLQNAAFLPMFRQAMGGRGPLREAAIERLEPVPLAANGPKAVEEIFAELSQDRQAAAGEALAYLQANGAAEDLIAAARRLVLLKGDDPHDYKFSAAVLEDYYHVSTDWRDRFLAASMVQLRGSAISDNKLIERARAALKG